MNDAQAAIDAATQSAAPTHAAQAVAPIMAAAAAGSAPAAPQAPVAPEPPRSGGDPNNPAWLPDRLKAAKTTAQRELLETAGFKSPDELAAALAELKTLRDAKLSDSERKDNHIKELEGKATKLESMQKSFAQVVGERFDKLSEEQRTAIDDIANGDPELRWGLLRVIQASPSAAAAPAVAQTETPTPAPPARANTSPAGAPPAPPKPADPESAFGIWQRKQQEDPTGASLYYRMNSVAIERSRPAST